ncbi:MAG TPA: hypothetical protein DCY20_00500 [Firmicutes bacterium]|nr:hypothetical protein [Bacillota bacterium]
MKKLFKYTPYFFLFICLTVPFISMRSPEMVKIIDISSIIEKQIVHSTTAINQEEPTIDNDRQTVISSKTERVSQSQIIEQDVHAAEFSINQLTAEIKTLSKQQTTLTTECFDYETDLEKNYLNKLIKIRNGIENQKASESQPQIRSNGLKAVNAMIDMMSAYINNPSDSTYISLGEEASRYIQRAFGDVQLSDTIGIVKYLTSAGPDQVNIGLKLKDAQTIATKFLNNYGYDGTEKGEAYKKNKRQQVATQTVMEVKQLELDELSLQLADLLQQLEEVTQ